MPQEQVTTHQPMLPGASTEFSPIIEHGESSTALILALSIFTSILVRSVTRFTQIVLLVVMRTSKPPQ